MGHDYALVNIESTDDSWLDFQGGSNGYDYDANLKRIEEVKLETVSKMFLTEAFNKLLEYESDIFQGIWRDTRRPL